MVILTAVICDVVSTMSCFQPCGHFLQHSNLSANHHVWLGDVYFHMRIGDLIGQAIAQYHRLVPEKVKKKKTVSYDTAYKIIGRIIIISYNLVTSRMTALGNCSSLPALGRAIPALVALGDPVSNADRLR